MKAVLDTKPESAYDDDIARWYHFPSRYLPVVSQCVGDWVVYRQTRRARGGHIGYFAVARIAGVRPDPDHANHHYADVVDFLPFDTVVPWQEAGRYAEARLRALEDRTKVGRTLQGHSVRDIGERDFAAIVRYGLSETLDPANALRLGLDYQDLDPAINVSVNAVSENFERRVEQLLLNRKIRDAAFRANVCAAYDSQCAITGLRIINGGGRAEVQAAHIWPVSEGGPDTVQNGIALSSTVHWLFDRHLISIGDGYNLLVSHNRIPREFTALFEQQAERIILPDDEKLWPSRAFLARHREAFLDA